jgi:hypothetical protein
LFYASLPRLNSSRYAHRLEDGQVLRFDVRNA